MHTQDKLKNGDLTGIYGYDIYYNKTNYEISYGIYEKENKKIIVIKIGTKENFYSELKKYIKRQEKINSKIRKKRK